MVQGFSDPRLGPQALELLASGYAPDAVIRALERSEDCFEYRQLAVINLHGHTAVHAGSRAPGLCATATGANCAAGGSVHNVRQP